MLEVTELYPAFGWVCDSCGKENFVNGTVHEFDEETEQEVREDYGIEVWEEGDFITIPDIVECSYCYKQYTTADYRAEELDEE